MAGRVFKYILTASAFGMMVLNPGCRKAGEEGRGVTDYGPVTAEREPPSVVALISEEESGGLALEPGCTLFWFDTKRAKWSVIAHFENDVFIAAAANADRDVIAVAGISYTWPSLTHFFRVYELRGEADEPYLRFAVEGTEYASTDVVFNEYDDVFYVSATPLITGEKTALRGGGFGAEASGRVIFAYNVQRNVLEEVVTTSDFVGLKAALGKRTLWVDTYEEPDIRLSAVLDLGTGELSPAGYDSSAGRVPPLVYYSRSPGKKRPFVTKALVTFSSSSRAGPDLTLGDYVYCRVFYSVGEEAFVFLEDPPGEGPLHLKVKRVETGREYSYAMPPLNWRKNYRLLFVE